MINKKDNSPYQFACIRKMLSIRSDGIHMELFLYAGCYEYY